MINEIKEGIYQIQIPLPNTPLKATNDYFIRGTGRNMWIDTAFDYPSCRQAMAEAMEKLGVNMAETDIFLTHHHHDHTGLLAFIAKPDSHIYCSHADGMMIKNSNGKLMIERFTNFLRQNAQELLKDNIAPPHDEILGESLKDKKSQFIFVEDGDVISVGRYNLRCILTPGHTDGHVCLFDEGNKLLFSGDHVLDHITPNITLWEPMKDTLDEYLNSLDRVADLDVNLVLPGHRTVFTNLKERVIEIKAHHETRLEEILKIVDKKQMDAYEVAAHMKWSLTYDKWTEFPITQKLFATGEAMAHLCYLTRQGHLVMEQSEGRNLFSC